MNPDADYWTRLMALEASEKYQQAEKDRRYWWEMFQQAEANGDGSNAAEYWRHAYKYAKALADMREAVR
jgi:hypothetical protein